MSADAAPSSTEPPPAPAPPADPARRTVAIRTWSLVFQPVDIAELEGFDLVVISGVHDRRDNWLPPAQLAILQAQDVLVVAHVPLLDAPMPISPADRTVFSRSHRTDGGWGEREAALDRVREAARAGWDGVYLDDVDQAVALPNGAARVADFVNSCRTALPGCVVILQGIADRVVELADAVGPEMPLRRAAGHPAPSPRGVTVNTRPMPIPVDGPVRPIDSDTVPRRPWLMRR